MSIRWSIQIKKNRQRLYLYTHISYISYTYPIHITLVVPSRQCLFTYYINFLAWRQRIISLVCFANNAILMPSIRGLRWCRYSTEKCLPDSHLPFVYVVILSISNLENRGDKSLNQNFKNIVFNRHADTAKLTGPRTFADKRWVGPVKLLCIIMFNISKIRSKSPFGPVKAQKFLQCLGMPTFGKNCRRPWLHGLKNQS